MENKLADFLTDEKIPKPMRYITLAAVIAFVDWVLLSVAAVTPIVIVKVLFYAIAALMIAVGMRLAVTKIHRS